MKNMLFLASLYIGVDEVFVAFNCFYFRLLNEACIRFERDIGVRVAKNTLHASNVRSVRQHKSAYAMPELMRADALI